MYGHGQIKGCHFRNLSSEQYAHFFIRDSFIRNVRVLGRPYHQETFSTEAMEARKLMISLSYHNFEDTVTNFDKDMFRKESLCGTNFYRKPH